MTSTLSTKNYPYKGWGEIFTDAKVNIDNLKLNKDWRKIFEKIITEDIKDKINNLLSKCLAKYIDIKIYPYPDLVFNSFNSTPFDKLKVCIIFQDPYHDSEIIDDKVIPQAMGISTSIPIGMKIPSSLQNIYNNLVTFKHIKEKPIHGNLTKWAEQGVLLMNSALTVQHGYPNSHEKTWEPFTNEIIKYISDKKEGIIFMLCGAPALKKLDLIDTEKHYTTISSHPSGLSVNKPLRKYLPFKDCDHFGFINKTLKANKLSEIDWTL